ncbi:hypothetical protein BDA96_06G231400 [Sorghum bicolor]|uniref:Uncharacterized protein n=1 Tax=Sorghum bicolor TaxID=4558 RepID=A0A921QVB9_SORBI|nr:hypothetical protein BDA96_06G231400 [Sorghum bicolor]
MHFHQTGICGRCREKTRLLHITKQLGGHVQPSRPCIGLDHHGVQAKAWSQTSPPHLLPKLHPSIQFPRSHQRLHHGSAHCSAHPMPNCHHLPVHPHGRIKPPCLGQHVHHHRIHTHRRPTNTLSLLHFIEHLAGGVDPPGTRQRRHRELVSALVEGAARGRHFVEHLEGLEGEAPGE